jgi:hypothetical protein
LRCIAPQPTRTLILPHPWGQGASGVPKAKKKECSAMTCIPSFYFGALGRPIIV